MVQEIRRLENAIQATEIPTQIAKESLGTRQRRIDTDLVQDNTENQLLKELECISGVKATLTECLRNARDQLTASREAKHNLEMDWSDKVKKMFNQQIACIAKSKQKLGNIRCFSFAVESSSIGYEEHEPQKQPWQHHA